MESQSVYGSLGYLHTSPDNITLFSVKQVGRNSISPGEGGVLEVDKS